MRKLFASLAGFMIANYFALKISVYIDPEYSIQDYINLSGFMAIGYVALAIGTVFVKALWDSRNDHNMPNMPDR